MPTYQENMQRAIESTSAEIAALTSQSALYGLSKFSEERLVTLVNRMTMFKEWLK